ncbi:MAG: exo-alpha-sialidase [Acidobacteria bacterium]|nr:exo-alpha-sialidase [Acidobacteriota bacterium]
MELTRYIKTRDGDVLLLVGTMKGAFLLSSDGDRRRWEVSGPHFAGQPVYALAYDGRQGRRRLWAGTKSWFFGTLLRSSDDFGKTWTNPETATIKFPEDTGLSLAQIWQIEPGRENEPDTLYCGVEPAALFESRDGGQSWSLVRGLFDHPHRTQWNPGNGGLCLHTILPDPSNPYRLHVAISAGGVYRTDDGGQSWKACNQGIRADFQPVKYPEFGQCVHKMARHPARPERIYLQNHGGLYRSDDGGDSWHDIANGVPSDFGFAMVMHPQDADTVWIVPLEADMRCAPEARLCVYRTQNGGRTWEALARGLPQKGAYETVLRDGMAADTLRPAGVYFGTRSGKLYGSRNHGNSWKMILEGLPPIVCVKAAVVGESKSILSVARKGAQPDARRKPRRPARRAA